jgi:hypothetical protein
MSGVKTDELYQGMMGEVVITAKQVGKQVTQRK